MKTTIANSNRKLTLSSARGLAVLGAALLSAPLSPAAEISADPTASAGEAATNALLAVAIPVAAFENIPTQGKDPFFPNSTRRAPLVKVAAPVVQVVPVNNASQLTLRGISGSPTKRIALINNLTFVAGEEGKVRIPGGLLKLRVIEVKDSSATIKIDGENVHRELRLRDGVADKNTGIEKNVVTLP